MSVRVNRRELGAALKKLAPIVKGAGTLAILRSVRLISRPDASTLTISGTDLRLSLSVEIACEEGAQALSALADHKRLEEVCSSEWSEVLELSVGVDGKLDVAGETRTRLARHEEESYPSIAEPPADAAWMGLRGEVVAAISRAARWAEGEDERRHVPAQAKFVWVFGTEVGEERVLGVCGCGEYAGLCEYLAGVTDPAVGHKLNHEGAPCLAIGKGAAGALAGLADGEGLEMLDAEGKHFFRGEGWVLSEVKGETGGADIRRFLEDPKLAGDGMRPLPSMGNLLKVIEAAPRRVASIDSRVLFEVKPVSPSGSRCSVSAADVSWSGEVAADLPPFVTYKPEELLTMLLGLDRIAGTDLVIEAGLMMKHHLRFEVEGRAVAFLMGVTR